jgi:hypothetical protein
MCTRISAIRRLVNLYIERLLKDPDYHFQVCIIDVLTEQNISTVQHLEMYRDTDRYAAAYDHAADDREMRLLRAWLSSPAGSVQ